jgi:hypothetical protein
VRLLSLYPRAWRERYEAEVRAVLDQHDVTLATRLDLLRGAADAWLHHGRNPLSPTTSAIARGARMGLVPCLCNVAQFVLILDLRVDSLLFNLAGLASVPVWFLACAWAGKRQAEGGGDWPRRLLAGAVAGAVGIAASIVVGSGLNLIEIAFGTPGLLNHPHALVFSGAQASEFWGNVVRSIFPATVLVVLVCTVLGAAVAAVLGTLANVVMPVVAGWLLGGAGRPSAG